MFSKFKDLNIEVDDTFYGHIDTVKVFLRITEKCLKKFGVQVTFCDVLVWDGTKYTLFNHVCIPWNLKGQCVRPEDNWMKISTDLNKYMGPYSDELFKKIFNSGN